MCARRLAGRRHALTNSTELREGGDAFDWFYLAIAQNQLGHKDGARSWYDKSVDWAEINEPRNEELRRLRGGRQKPRDCHAAARRRADDAALAAALRRNSLCHRPAA